MKSSNTSNTATSAAYQKINARVAHIELGSLHIDTASLSDGLLKGAQASDQKENKNEDKRVNGNKVYNMASFKLEITDLEVISPRVLTKSDPRRDESKPSTLEDRLMSISGSHNAMYTNFLLPITAELNNITPYQISEENLEEFKTNLSNVFKLIESKKKEFVNNYRSKLPSGDIETFSKVLEDLKSDIKQILHSTHPELFKILNLSVVDEKNRIADARHTWTNDMVCLFACFCWLPIEKTVTLFHCCTPCLDCCPCKGSDDFSIQNEDCFLAPHASDDACGIDGIPGRYSIFAPLHSIHNLQAERKQANKTIETYQPMVQTMK